MNRNRAAVFDAAKWAWTDVARPLKYTFMWFVFMGSIGRLGRSLIEGLEWWIKLVDLYNRVMAPVAEVIGLVLREPIIWIASLLGFHLEIPVFPAWGVDVIVLANVAAGFLVYRHHLTVPAQFFVGTTIVVSLSVLIFGGNAYLASDTLFSWSLTYLVVLALGALLAWRSFLTQFIAIYKADYHASLKKMNRRHFPEVKITHYSLKIGEAIDYWLRDDPGRKNRLDKMGAKMKMLFAYFIIFAIGVLASLLNKYADVALPVATRFGNAWDTMILENVLKPIGMG